MDRNQNTQDYDQKDAFDWEEDTVFDDEENVNPHDNVAANMGGYREPLDDFHSFCDSHQKKFKELTKEEEGSIKLMDILRRKKAPLNAFPEVLEWHLKESGKLREHESLKDTENYKHRGPLLNDLMRRHNVVPMLPKTKKVKLPSSKTVASIPCREAKDCVVSLLTDPRFEDEDYLFWDDDPYAKPPEKIEYLGDLNTGDAYLETHKKMITKPNQILVPICMYIDAANSGQFSDLPITALKMSLGIHKRETRDKPWAWRELGWVPQVRKEKARGRKMFKDSGHVDGEDVEVEDGEGDEDSGLESEDLDNEDADPENNGADLHDYDADTEVKAQDFHTMLATILESFVELQKTGMVFDFVYRGKLHKGAELVFYVAFVKCDTEEGDLLCGKYTCRTGNVKHVCRYCHCPMDEADDPRARYGLKKQKDIQELVETKQLAKLQAMSQQHINNAWYKVTFHKANECGIHGACPSEMLHALLLGIFKYLRDTFFVHMGKSSKLADSINGLATEYAHLFTRQSEKDMPSTTFTQGIAKGKLMATKFRGVLLVMAAVLRSTEGRKLLLKRKRFGGKPGLQDWTLLVELLLEWESFLCQKKIKKKHVKKLNKKHRYIMYVLKNVAERTQGMKMKLMKFHAIIHMVQDMLLYGVPKEFDTGSNESHHKPSKQAAKLTQRNERTFDDQTATRLTEFLCIDLALYEVLSGIGVWHYFNLHVESDESRSESEDSNDLDTDSRTMDVDSSIRNADNDNNETNSVEMSAESHGFNADSRPNNGADLEESESEASNDGPEAYNGGTKIRVYEDERNGNKASFKILGRSKHKQSATWSRDIKEFLNNLQNLVIDHIPTKHLTVFTEHTREGVTFRGHPHYRGNGRWTSWAVVDYGPDEGKVHCRIWCFVKLRQMPTERKERLWYGGTYLEDATYAVVECTKFNEDPDEIVESDLFVPLTMELHEDSDANHVKRKFYLADVEAFCGPCCVVPDIGGPRNAFFKVKPRSQWKEEFVIWLKQRHKDDKIEDDE